MRASMVLRRIDAKIGDKKEFVESRFSQMFPVGLMEVK